MSVLLIMLVLPWCYYQVEMSVLADELLTRVHDEEHRGSAKVTVVGTGQVGMAAAFAMMTQVAEIYTRCTRSFIHYNLWPLRPVILYFFPSDTRWTPSSSVQLHQSVKSSDHLARRSIIIIVTTVFTSCSSFILQV